MLEFFRNIFEYPFLMNALLGGLCASFACAITGTFVLLKRIIFISGGIAHAALGGIGAAVYFGYDPLFGALAGALFCALFIGIVNLYFKQNEDLLIGVFWALGMAVGIIFMHLTPGYSVDLTSFLFGDIMMVSRQALLLLSALNGVILLLVTVFYRQLIFVCFDEEYASIRGIYVKGIYLLLLCLIALTIVIVIQVVGIILVIALLSIPAAIAALISKSPLKMMGFAFLFGSIFTVCGLALSNAYDIPSGSSIILVAGVAYFLALCLHMLYRYITQKKSLEEECKQIS